jgi:hypothetical protein
MQRPASDLTIKIQARLLAGDEGGANAQMDFLIRMNLKKQGSNAFILRLVKGELN